MSEPNSRPPRETVIRAMSGVEFRSQEDLGRGYLGLLRIRFSPVNEWTEINSAWEGRFMERFAPGAWKKTIKERAGKIRALFQHGQDPTIGDKPLGPFHRLEEDDEGGYAEVKLLDTSYNRDLVPGIEDGLYGASHRFGVVRATEDDRPERSERNPDGIKEVTVTEARLHELGPVTWPAYEGATSGMRSMTDEFLMSCFRSDPEKLRDMFAQAVCLEQDIESPTYSNYATIRRALGLGEHKPEPETQDEQPQDPKDEQDQQDAPSTSDAAPKGTSPAPERRDPNKGRYGLTEKEGRPSWAL